MTSLEEYKFEDSSGRKTFYLASGPRDGPLIIFCHGWPAIAKTWKAQLQHFAALGYRVVAPDMPGYGKSSTIREKEKYSLESVNKVMLSVLAECGREKAIWIGHDWGAGAVWSFVAHYPEKTTAVVGLARPYHTIEYGLATVVKTVNRDIFPIDKYPYGQYDYQVYCESHHDALSSWMDLDTVGVLRAVYTKGHASDVGKPGFTATVTRDGGWFGGGSAPPAKLRSIPVEELSIDEEMLADIVQAIKPTGFWAPNAWYMNHGPNERYSVEKAKNGGRLEMPVLFVGANWDPINDITVSGIAEAQREYCGDLKEVAVDAGHWVQLEKPDEVNAFIEEWLKEKAL